MATIDRSNLFYGDKLQEMTREQTLMKTLYLDLSLSQPKSGIIDNINKNTDMLFLQTSHVIHTHVMPFIVYFIKKKHLYRVESAQKLSYPFESNINAVIDDFGEIKTFRIYKNSTHFLLDLNLDGKNDNLLKIRHLNAM